MTATTTFLSGSLWGIWLVIKILLFFALISVVILFFFSLIAADFIRERFLHALGIRQEEEVGRRAERTNLMWLKENP